MNHRFAPIIVFAFSFLLFLSCSNESNKGNSDQNSDTDTTGQTPANGQQKRLSPPDSAVLEIDGLSVRIYYGSPSVRGRKVFGELVPYGELWRTGANEATTIETNQEVLVNENRLPAGKYALFTIPGESQWTVVINKVADQWGAYEYNEKEDLLRFEVPADEGLGFLERMKIYFETPDDTGATMRIHWERSGISLQIKSAV